jgi:hypothetical protein
VDNVTEPVDAETVIWLAVPVNAVTPPLVTVTAPVVALTEIPVPALTDVTFASV